MTRRQFIGTAAAAAVVGPRLAAGATPPRVVVVGAGAFGAWTALHLQRAGARVTLIDAWGPGNARASSGGETRVIRAVYGSDEIYTEMVRRAYGHWRGLAATTDAPLYTPTGALWLLRSDEAAYVESALAVLDRHGFKVEELALAEARRRWPQIRFDGIRRVFLEHEAGALAARQGCRIAVEQAVAAGAEYLTGSVRPPQPAGAPIKAVELPDGTRLAADAYVFACGPWLGRLFPEVLGDAIRPTRQDVFFFGPPAGNRDWLPDAMPVWIDFGARIFYGLPDLHARGFKIADDTRGEPVDPTSLDRIPDTAALARARALLSERFPALADAPLIGNRVCQYENSPDGDLILDRHPGAANVWLAGGGSGHGFKLSPAVGEDLAGAILNDAPLPAKFSLARLESASSGTQFEH